MKQTCNPFVTLYSRILNLAGGEPVFRYSRVLRHEANGDYRPNCLPGFATGLRHERGNPHGQYLSIEHFTGLPITEAPAVASGGQAA